MPNNNVVLWWNSKDNLVTLMAEFKSNFDIKNIRGWTEIVIEDASEASQNISNVLFYDK